MKKHTKKYMKKRILTIFVLSAILLSSCLGGTEESSEQMEKSSVDSESKESSVFSEGEGIMSDSESIEDVENSEYSEFSESEESEDNSQNSDITESEESSEKTESSEMSESSESPSTSNPSETSKETETESSVPDSSYEIMDTPVIPVPDKVEAAEEDAFFNDSVFVGNSILLGYQKFANKQRAGSIPSFMGTAKFFCAGNYGVNKANANNAPLYEGKQYSVEDVIGAMGAKTVYINFMGLNDLSWYYDPDNCSRKCADDVIKLIEKINSMYPDVEVVILSATYITASRNNYSSLNNKNLSMMNNYLLEYCNEKGLDFVDIASQLTEKGCLADKYASDGYCHIWTPGYKVWTAILRDYAVRKTNGTYKNPEKMPILGINK